MIDINETTVASAISESLQLTVPPNVVVTILRETANDVISRCNPSHGIASARRETTISTATSFLKRSEQYAGEAVAFAKLFQDFLAPCLFEKDGVGN